MEGEIKALDWMSDATKERALEKLHAIAQQGRLSRQVARLHDARGQARRLLRERDRAATSSSRERQLAQDRQAGGPRRVGHDAADGERLLQPADERHQLPGRRPAAAALRSEDGRRAQLRQHGRDDRPRADARLRRRGPPVRRQGQPEGLVDAPTDAKAFEERVECVRDQYAQYTIVDDIKINSKLTLGRGRRRPRRDAPRLHRLEGGHREQDLQPVDGFTPDQRFFIGMAQWACENQRPENLRAKAITDLHSPLRYRVNGIVSDLPQFQKAFGCSNEKPMVRKRACRVW